MTGKKREQMSGGKGGVLHDYCALSVGGGRENRRVGYETQYEKDGGRGTETEREDGQQMANGIKRGAQPRQRAERINARNATHLTEST